MKSKMILPAIVFTALVCSSAVNSQEQVGRQLPGTAIPCPVPLQVNLTSPPPAAATPFAADFPSAGVVEPNFGGTATNRHFRHTFTWKAATDCCQYIKGTLTITYKALNGGQSATTPDAGNDKWYVFKNGASLTGGSLYTSFPFSAGQTGTKTIPLTHAMLSGDRLSFLVQDDTSITSAKLNVVGCCVRK